MITVSAFLSYAKDVLIMKFDPKRGGSYDGLYCIKDFVNLYGEKHVKWFSTTNGNGYLVIELEEE